MNQHHQHHLGVGELIGNAYYQAPPQTYLVRFCNLTRPPTLSDLYAIKTPEAPPQWICVGHLAEFPWKSLWV